MTIPAPAPSALGPVRWLNNQPYLLLSLTSLFWAGNIVLARHVAGHVPPMTLSCVRWIGAFLMLLPFAWPHLKQDWPALRARLPLMVLLSADRIFHQQRAVLLGAAIHRGAECAVDPVLRTAVRGGVVADAVRRQTDPGPTRRHHDLAAGRTDHHPAWRLRRTRQHPVQQGRRDGRRRAAGFRTLFGADAVAAEDASAVVYRLYHRLRRRAAAAVFSVGILGRLHAEAGSDDATALVYV